jgi:hypothetical protein
MKKIFMIIISCIISSLFSEILIPMDNSQSNHLKAYGIAFQTLLNGQNVKWLLNYRGGSYLMNDSDEVETMCNIRGVSFEKINSGDVLQIISEIKNNNMDIVTLEKAPKIAVYTPPNSQPWDDAVTLVLNYAQIKYDTLWDEEILAGKLSDYDWIHLHHEDFTGQYGKFYSAFRSADWYKTNVKVNENMAHKLGFKKVWELKHKVVEIIKEYVKNGGVLFAMCAATDTFDIALAAENVDIVPAVFDGDGIDTNYKSKLNFANTFAFTDFTLITNPMEYEFSSIDASDYAKLRGAEDDYFTLFDFSAKYDPVPTMLTQCQTNAVNGFMGQTTSFHKKYIKKSVIIMGESPGTDEVKYLHGNFGKGTFTFYGGHDPEDYQHRIGDPPTDLALHKNSPGYRLILNNVLFPAAKKKKLKT